MKLFQPFKGVFLATMAALFGSGAVVYVLKSWFQTDRGMGPEPRPIEITTLQIHSIIGLFFLILFGYLWATHVLPGWRRRRRLKTGVLMAAICIVLIATVPFLFYASGEGVKSTAAWLHSYLGLASIAPFFIHWLAKD